MRISIYEINFFCGL